MTKKVGVIGVALASLWAVPAIAAEAGLPPSPFETGLSGFGMGVGAGLAGGYLVARSGGSISSEWRAVVAGGVIGALAGGTAGLTLGFVANGPTSQGRGYLIIRDMSYGGSFGAVFGGLIGGLVALRTNHLENVLFGAAIGTLSGTALGLVYGSLERNPWASGAEVPRKTAWNVGVVPLMKAGGTLSLGPSVSGRF